MKFKKNFDASASKLGENKSMIFYVNHTFLTYVFAFDLIGDLQ